MLTKIKSILLLMILLFITSCGNDEFSKENSDKEVVNGIGIKQKSIGGNADTKGQKTIISEGELEKPNSEPNIIK